MEKLDYTWEEWSIWWVMLATFTSRRLLPGFILCILPTVGLAFSITNVEVVPAAPITPADDIAIVVGITTPSQGAFLFMPTTLEQSGNSFTVDIFISDEQILPATDFLDETVLFGTLAPGEYSYLIRLTTGYFVNFGIREVSGQFTVVPAPAALLLFASALASLLSYRSR